MMRQFIGKAAGWAIAATVSAMPATAFARPHFEVNVHIPVAAEDCDRPVSFHHETRVWVEPIYRAVTDRQWLEPVYQTVVDHAWVPESTKQENVRVWVSDRYEFRDVVYRDWGRRVIRHERVLVEAAHYEVRPGAVCVVPAHFEDVSRQQLVCEGHWQDVRHQELVREGHWEMREAFIPAPPPRPGFDFELHLPIR